MNVIKDVKTLLGKDNSLAPKTPILAQKVLIVEDEAMLAEMYEKKFQLSGFQTFKAGNGEEGLDMVAKHTPDIILLDLIMPVMDGKSMLRRLRELPECKNTPVIVLTNAGNVDNMRETKTYYNAEAFLVKASTTPDEIIEVATDLLKMSVPLLHKSK